MITIDWSCGYGAGYGDIVSPLCYAQNQSEIYDDVVTLVLNWTFTESQITGTSPDTKVQYLIEKFDFNNIKIINKYDQIYNKWENVNESLKSISVIDPLHSVYFPVPHSNINPKYTVVCSTLNNAEQFDTFAEGKRKWKDTISNDEWRNLINQPNTIHIDYRTPLHEAIDVLYNCKFFIGYHGSCSWLARLMGVPLKIYSNSKKFTSFSFPWSLNMNEPVDYEKGLMKVEHYRVLRDKYIDTVRSLQDVHSNKESLLD